MRPCASFNTRVATTQEWKAYSDAAIKGGANGRLRIPHHFADRDNFFLGRHKEAEGPSSTASQTHTPSSK